MGVLDVLSGLATAAGGAAQGEAIDQQTAVKNALAQAKAAQEAERDRVLNLLTQRQIATPILGEPGYTKGHADVAGAEADAKVPAAVSEARQKAPIAVQQAADTAQAEVAPHVAQAAQTAAATLPTEEAKHEAARSYDVAHPEPTTVSTAAGVVRVPSAGPAVPITDAQGNPVIKAGGAGGTAAPLAARVGQVGLALRAAGAVIPLHEQLAQSGVPFGAGTEAQTAQGKGMLGKIPFVSEFANKQLNSGDNQTYAQYNAALPNLLLGATHAISGARINQQQLETLEEGLKQKYGDTPPVKQQKLTNLVDFLNSMRASLPPDMIAAQEKGIDSQTMAVLKAHGYGGAPTGYAYGQIRGLPDIDKTPGYSPTNLSAAGDGTASGEAGRKITVNGKTFTLPQ